MKTDMRTVLEHALMGKMVRIVHGGKTARKILSVSVDYGEDGSEDIALEFEGLARRRKIGLETEFEIMEESEANKESER